MLRSLSLAVLAFLILTAAVPAFAAEPARPDGSLAAIFDAPGETGEEAPFPTQDNPQNDLRNKACIFICEAGWGVTTSMKRGTGSDCTAANSNLSSQIGSEAVSIGSSGCSNAGAALGYCGWVLHVTVSCHWDFVLGTYVADGYGDVKCKDYC
jgi:hypothetical protein